MKVPMNDARSNSSGAGANSLESGTEKKITINAELWQACAGPLVNLPVAGTHVVYFPQGHSEQVSASLKKGVDAPVPNYPNLPSKLICLLHSVTLHADSETDEVYAQMALQPVASFDKEALLRSDLSLKSHKPQTELFCKTLTASDTSTHGGFSVPRRAAEKTFPLLDFSMQPPAQELVARDLHGTAWTFRHIYRGQPKRHLLTTGWSLFISGKRLFAGDSVLFIRDEKQELLLGIRRANKQTSNLSSSVLSSDSMHIGILAAAANAAANYSPFTVFFNPRASPSEFVIPLAKYYKAVYSNQISLGMRFRMMFETEDSGIRRYMGTITGISDMDPVRWKNSQWRNLQVGWDESTAGERRSRVSLWEIEPVTTPFFICPPPLVGAKRPRVPGMPDDGASEIGFLFKRSMPWLGEDICLKDPHALPGSSLTHWMTMQQNPSIANSIQPNYMQSLSGCVSQNLGGADVSRHLALSASQIQQPNNMQFNAQRLHQQSPQLDQLPKLQSMMSPLGNIVQPLQQLSDIAQQTRQSLINHALPSSQVQSQMLQPRTATQNNDMLQQQSLTQSHQPHGSLPQQQQIMTHNPPDFISQEVSMSDNQLQFQLLQKLQQKQQSLLVQQSMLQHSGQLTPLLDHQRQQLDVPHSFSKSLTTSEMMEAPQVPPPSRQSNSVHQQMTTNNSQTNVQFSQQPQQHSEFQQQQYAMRLGVPGHVGMSSIPTTNHTTAAGTCALVGAAGLAQSVTTDDAPSCSTSPSTNNGPSVVRPDKNYRSHLDVATWEDMAQSAATLSSDTLVNISSNANSIKDLQQKSDVKPSFNISQACFAPHTYLNGAGTQIDYLDTSSSTTSVCISQNEVHLQQNNDLLPYNPQSILFRETTQYGDVQADIRNNIPDSSNIGAQLEVPLNSDPFLTKDTVALGTDISNHLSSAGMLVNYENSKEAQQVLSSSMVSSQALRVPDVTFNSIDSSINDESYMNSGAWIQPPPPPFQRMRTFTKVYKRGAVGRSIDITSYSGYEVLKQDLARRFGIEDQLEDQQRIGWKLVYVDHENDVLLVGDDPWEEFVNCVRCIKILSPQEVQQMSLNGDFGSGVLANQAFSSSDGGNA